MGMAEEWWWRGRRRPLEGVARRGITTNSWHTRSVELRIFRYKKWAI